MSSLNHLISPYLLIYLNLTKLFMLDNGKMENEKGWGNSTGMMDLYMKDIGKIIWLVEKVFFFFNLLLY